MTVRGQECLKDDPASVKRVTIELDKCFVRISENIKFDAEAAVTPVKYDCDSKYVKCNHPRSIISASKKKIERSFNNAQPRTAQDKKYPHRMEL